MQATMRRTRCLLVAWSALFVVGPSYAQAPSAPAGELRLSWVRSATAANCPGAEQIEADVERRLGWPPFNRTRRARESIEVFVNRQGEQWRADIAFRAPDGSSRGSRQVESTADTCTSLAAAAGLAIALMIEPLLPVQPAPMAAAPALSDPQYPPASDPRPAVAVLPPPPPRARARAHEPNLAFALGAVGVAGALPSFAVGPTLVGSIRAVDRFYVVLSASLLPEQRVRAAGADVGFGMTLGSMGGCYRLPLARTLGLSSCAAFVLGSLQVIVRAPEPVLPGASVWSAVSTGLRVDWNTGRFDVALGIDALGHFQRHVHGIETVSPPGTLIIFAEPTVAVASSVLVGVSY